MGAGRAGWISRAIGRPAQRSLSEEERKGIPRLPDAKSPNSWIYGILVGALFAVAATIAIIDLFASIDLRL